MQNNHRVVFFGTPKIAQTCLQALLDKNINIVAVVTKKDTLVGRKQISTPSDVKILAQKHNIEVIEVDKLSLIANRINELQPELIITCAFGKIVPESILNIPKFRCVNVHTSLLPRWRGGAPIHHAIWHNDKYTGVTLMYMDKGLDTGNVIFQESINIGEDETYKTLYEKLSDLSYKMLFKHIEQLFSVNLISFKQDETKTTIAPVITKNDEKIEWNKTASEVDCQIRALFDKPIAYTIYKDQRIKILKCLKIDRNYEDVGKIIEIASDGILVSCRSGSILLKQIQLPSKKPTYIKDLINGKHLFEINTFFI